MNDHSEIPGLLSSMKPGQLPEDVFAEVARLTVIPVVELVPIYEQTDGTQKVLLLRRGDDDPTWPEKYHVPGTIIRATDSPGELSDAIGRILNGSLRGYNPLDPKFAGLQLCSTLRGKELAVIYTVELTVEPRANLFDVDSLPAELIEGHANFIETALRTLS